MQYSFFHMLFLFSPRSCSLAQPRQPGGEPSKIAGFSLRRQHGFAMVEFLVVALPLMFATMASYEASRWYMTRQAVSLALLEAGRAGSVNHTRPQAIEAAFLDALAPLYAPAGAFFSPHERMLHQQKRFEQDHGQLAWDIVITHPDVAEFADFMQKDLPIAVKTGNPAINNNYQHRQHQQYPRGPASGSTIYDANTLQLQARYLYVPVVPGMRTLLRTVFGAIDASGSPLATHGVLPISAAITIEMQSHPVLWLSEQTPHVRYKQRHAFASSPGPLRKSNAKAGTGDFNSGNGDTISSKASQPATPNATHAGDAAASQARTDAVAASSQHQPSVTLANNESPESALPADSACVP
ncbi:hypothetical protein EV681_3822 [Advenella incenata]|uniref:TadE-like protein n=1 Tax=Advenella incenata TaxID=267800 RepID=A0A4Q7VB11_9BURK|nr:hypothetical protein EV681_3822 [Advenella incenata]